MRTRTYYLASYIDALESTKVDTRNFADLDEQRAFFRRKCLESIDWSLINASELARRANMTPARLQDIRRGKIAARSDDLRALLIVITDALS